MRDASGGVALVHDYLTQRGGAERVVLAMQRAFPGAPLYTSLYDPPRTFPEFHYANVRTAPINRGPGLRRYHRLALPMLAHTFSTLRVDAAVAVCSSSGWAHGATVSGRKVVYCHTPARWLYQTDRYLGRPDRTKGAGQVVKRAGIGALRARLEKWDRAAAASADRYLVVSTAVASAVRELYGI